MILKVDAENIQQAKTSQLLKKKRRLDNLIELLK